MGRQKIKYVNFTKLPDDDLLEILNERNSERIRSKMINQELISPDDHLNFCRSLAHDKSKIYVKAMLDGEFIGVIDAKCIDRDAGTYEPGSYFKEQVPERVIIAALTGFLLICLNEGFHNPLIKVRRDNLQAFFFNVMKCGCRIIGEDDEVYLLSSDFLNPQLHTEEECRANIMHITKDFDLEFDL